MRKFFLGLLFVLPANLIQADESLRDFGLSDLVPLPATAGDLVRGTGYSSGLSSISLFVYNPASGSSVNASASSRSVGHSGAATLAGFTPSLTGSLAGLSFNFSGSVFTFGASHGSSADFGGSQYGFCDGPIVSPNPGGQTGSPPSGGGNGNAGNGSNGQGLGLTQDYGLGNNF